MYPFFNGFLMGFVLSMGLTIALDTRAQDDVVYCTNDGGQTIIVIKKGYACPFGWYEIQL